jgi:hypothetical protein
MEKYLSGFLVLPLLLLLASCTSQLPAELPASGGKAGYEIRNVLFVFEDIHPSFWSSASSSDSLFLSVFIYFDAVAPAKEEIEEIRIYDESRRFWTMSLDDHAVAGKSYIGGYTRFRTDEYSLNWSVMSLSVYRIELHLKNKRVYTHRYNPPDPDENGRDTKLFLYSADYAGRKDDSYIQTVARAVITEAKRDGGIIAVTFAVDDERAGNGEIVFYNTEKKYAGETDRFRNIYSLETRPYLNGGTAFHVDGRDNRAVIGEEDIEFSEGRSFDEIEYAMISLACNDPEKLVEEDHTIFRSKSELMLLTR